ncbi:MAG: hypothetical protein HKN16_00860 [Saprospiraceae bacterium]|nr:hypothetical protein [Saprospiraceae bacterium]
MQQNPSYFEDFFKSLRRKRAWKITYRVARRIVIGLVLLVLLFYLILQIPVIQQWAASRGTDYLSDQLKTKVSLGSFDFRFFDKLILEDFYIEDLKGDTLIFASELETSMSANLIALFSKRLDLDDIVLQNAKINLEIEQGDSLSNLQRIFLNLENTADKEEKSARPFKLDLQNIGLNNVNLTNLNRPKGLHQFYFMDDGWIEVESIDLAKNKFEISNVTLYSPDVLLELHPQNLVEVSSGSVGGSPTEDSLQNIFNLSLNELRLAEGTFRLNNYRWGPEKLTPDSIMDFRFLEVTDIVLQADDLAMLGQDLTCQLNKLALNESSGFKLNRLKSDLLKMDERSVSFFDMKLETPKSSLGDTLIFKFREWTDLEDFNNKVLMDARFKNAELFFEDLMAFAPGLWNNNFFRLNSEKKVTIGGRVQGRINNLRGRNVNLKMGERTQLIGNFNSRNLAIKQQEVLNLDLKRMVTDMRTLRLLVPNFTPPSNFDKLGDLDFNGRFDGFFVDFVAYGALNTNLGTAELDMRMDLRDGREKARYSGEMNLKDFDLGTWADNADFGSISIQSKVEDGLGLTLEDVNTALTATIDNFSFKNYNYQNAEITGRLTRNLFDGDLKIQDQNVDLDFSGAIRFGDTIPVFDFTASVRTLDLLPLNITQKPFSFTGDVDLNLVDNKIATIRGEASGKNLVLLIPGNDTLALDTVSLVTGLDGKGVRDLNFNSEVLQANMEGKFVLDEIPAYLAKFFLRNHPSISKRLKIKDPGPDVESSFFTYNIDVPDSKNFLKLLDPNLHRVKDFHLEGEFNSERDLLETSFDLPYFGYAENSFEDLLFSLEGNEEDGNIYMEVGKSFLEDLELEPITLRGQLHADSLDFQFNAFSWTSVLDNLQLQGSLHVTDENYQITFLPGELVILKEAWQIGENNKISFDKGIVDIENFFLSNSGRSFLLESVGNRGIKAEAEGFEFSMIDQVWDYDKLDFNGAFNLSLRSTDIFELKDLRLSVLSDTMIVNGEDWGVFRLDARGNTLKEPADVYLSITKEEAQLTAEGRVIPQNNPDSAIPLLDFDLAVSRYPLHILEYWIENGISNTSGNFDMALKVDGPLNYPNFNGDIRIYDGATTLDFLNTRYFIYDETAKVTNTYIDATGGLIRDEFGNVATVQGGLTHDHIKNMGLDATISSDNFLALNTQKGDNDLFYGTAFADGFVTFTGNFRKPNIFINAAPERNTQIVIPISDYQDAGEVSFIEFINDSDTLSLNNQNQASEVLGVEMDMRLAMNENAEMRMVFDEKAGDEIKGVGTGDIRIDMYRNGDFRMNGNYVITSGQYLFTTFNVINKPFEVKQGGLIQWSGDPYNADINIVAEYSRLRAAPYNFIEEYIESLESVKSEARQITDVDLIMNLTGKLLQPDIAFELSFPNVSPDIRNYVDSKLRSIEQDPNELNRQVFGLMVLGGFLPNTSASSNAIGDYVGEAVTNTLTEFLSSQLSLLLTDLVSDVVRDGGVLSGIQLDVNYSNYNATQIDQFASGQGNEIGLRPKFLLWDDRVSIEAGGGVNFEGATGTYFGNDVVVEFAISQDRRLKARAYQKYDNTVLGNRNQFGLGVTYRREGDTFKELFFPRRVARKKAEALVPEPEEETKGN